ncbi:MAG TPA: hypothetical protein VIF09_10600 [Polyangiaceae bacterium]
MFPRPPAQGTPWTPPATTLPASLLDATRAMVGEGLPDPRGLPYRAVELTVGDVWSGGGSPLKTHAWVLPTGADGGPATTTFVVAWNGLVYPALSVGEPADLEGDVAAIVAADEKMRADRARDSPGNDFYRFRQAWPESMSASHASLLPVKAALLLRAGQGKLAEQVWQAWTAGMRKDTNDDAKHLADPYLMLVTDWVWAAFDRAVCAHMRGDDPLSLADAEALAALRPVVGAEGVRRGLLAGGDAGIDEGPLGFLSPVDALLADETRRMARPARPPAPAAGADPGDAGPPVEPLSKRTVSSLVDDLDLVAARQWGQPGGVSLGEDPVVQALVAKGDEAVEPLLDCLEKDTRLTRSVHFWRDFAHSRSVLGVGEAAYVALAGILDASFFGPGSTGDDLTAHGAEGRKKVAAQVRAYWERWRGVPQEERWFRVLASDDLTADRWLEAAESIARPTNVTVVPSSMVWSSTVTTTTGGPPVLRGEVLRAKAGPTVTELMTRRVEMLALQPDGLAQATQMALLLHDWDRAGALPSMQRQSVRCFAAMSGPAPAEKTKYGAAVALLTTARASGGDRTALDEYAAWLGRLRPDDFGSSSYELTRVLEPLWQFPKDAAMLRVSRAMFAPHGAWSALATGRSGNAWGLSDLVETNLVEVAPFRERVEEALLDRKKIGTTKITSGGGLSVTIDAGGSMGTGTEASDPPPPVGTVMPFRVCDLVGWELARREHAPTFRIYWPEKKRDAALGEMAAFLRSPPKK